MRLPLSHFPLATAVGIAALVLIPGCTPPLVDLGPYTSQTLSDPDGSEGGTSAASLSATIDATDPATTDTTPATLATTSDGDDDTATTTTTTAVTATESSPDTTAEVGETDSTTGVTPGECGVPDPLHPFPAAYVKLGLTPLHDTCVLSKVGPPIDQPDLLDIKLVCPDPDMVDRHKAVLITLLERPFPDMIALQGKQIAVDIDVLAGETSPELHWIVLRRNDNLIYASVRGHTLLGAGMPGDTYAPLTFDTALGTCELAPTTSDWPPADHEGFACELAAPIFLGVRVNQDPKLLLKAGTNLEAPVVGGKYTLDVRAVTAARNCIPDFPPNTDVDTYSFAVALQAD